MSNNFQTDSYDLPMRSASKNNTATLIEAMFATLVAIRQSHPQLIADNAAPGWGMRRFEQAVAVSEMALEKMDKSCEKLSAARPQAFKAMCQAHGFCPTELDHMSKMRWMAAYMENALLDSQTMVQTQTAWEWAGGNPEVQANHRTLQSALQGFTELQQDVSAILAGPLPM